MNAYDLEEILARADAATPGPWTAHDDGLIWPEMLGDPICGVSLPADAQFIAHARRDIPALVDALNATRAELAATAADLARARCGDR